MFFACIVYSVVPKFVKLPVKPEAALNMNIVYALAGLAVLVFLAGVAYFKLNAAPENIKKSGDLKTALAKIQAVAVTSIAMFESISVFGLTLVFIGFSQKYALPFFVAGPAGLLLQLTMTLRVFSDLESDSRNFMG